EDDDELDAALGRVVPRRLHAGRRDEDAGRVRAGALHRVGHGAVDGDPFNVLARLLGVGARHDLRAVRLVAHAVEAALRPGEALVHDLRVAIDEDARATTPLASVTTVRAASSIVGFDTSRSDSCSFR